MDSFSFPPVANVTEPGDIVLYAAVLGITVAVGLALLAINVVVGRLTARVTRKTRPSSRRRSE